MIQASEARGDGNVNNEQTRMGDKDVWTMVKPRRRKTFQLVFHRQGKDRFNEFYRGYTYTIRDGKGRTTC